MKFPPTNGIIKSGKEMKTYSLLFIAATIALAGCQSPDDDASHPRRPMVPFSASANHGQTDIATSSRAIYDGNTTKWETNDKIAFYAESYGATYPQIPLSIETLSSNGKKATFRGTIPQPTYPDTFHAACPAEWATVNTRGTVFTLPDIQDRKGNLLMVAEAEAAEEGDVGFAFRVVNSLLRVNLPEGINSVTFSGCAGEELICNFVPIGPTSITIDNPGTECYFSLPAMILWEGYMLTLKRGDDSMVQSFSRNEFAPATCYTASVSNFTPISVIADPIATTSYSLWKSDGVEAANAWRTNVARFKASFAGTSNKVVECGVTIDGVEYPGRLDNPTGAKTFSVEIDNLPWGKTTATAYIKVGGVKYQAATTSEAFITGLPYTAAPPTATDWYPGSRNNRFTSTYAQIGGLGGDNEASITSSGFYVPTTIDIAVETDCFIAARYLLEWRETEFTVRANGENIIVQQSNSTEADYTLAGTGQLTASAATIKCESSSRISGPYVQIESIRVRYN